MDQTRDRDASTDQDNDPRVSTVPLDTEDGGTVVIEQQNAGPGQQVGAGEFKEDGQAEDEKPVDEAAAEQDELERRAPIHRR